jgi:uncharacterized ferredoxin-like protein
MITEEQALTDALRQTALQMAAAARTAPKGRGKNNIEICIAEKEDILRIAEQMNRMSQLAGSAFFSRDAGNILQAPFMLLVGCRIEPLRLENCGLCGFGNCDGKRQHPETPCTFNTTDLGIALGSAVSVASAGKADCRIMFSAGMAARALGMMHEDTKIIFGIPITALSKNPFFDRPQS